MVVEQIHDNLIEQACGRDPVDPPTGDTLEVSCTFDPTLCQELPQLRKLPPRFVVWSDGSSDEMCPGLVQTVKGVYHP